jgi:peptidyl-prolyl cis-trans isomerase SurA
MDTMMSNVARAALLVLLAATTGRAEVIDRVVATIDGDPITAYEFDNYVRERNVPSGPSREILEVLVTERLLEKEAAARGISARPEDIDRYVAEIKDRNKMDDATFTRALREQGLTLERYRAKVKAEIEKAQLINREIRGRVNVSPEEVKRHYAAHAGEYGVAERVRVRMIVLPVPPDASADQVAGAATFAHALREQAEAGADFAELARRYSRGPGAGDGGDLGFFSRGQMVDALEAVAFRLKPGELSEPIRTAGAVNLLKVEERQGASSGAFEEVAEEIREELYQQALEQRFQRWLQEDLRREHHVQLKW